ncbi:MULTISPECIES: hypothetical protein [unclassified Chryseobacterium]|uniref:hypothetical protein n=1 Tax=unclassified Chryseobacterium TaxID=2593645 RepID=UPI00300FC908
MKTTSKIQYAFVNQILIAVVGAVFGFNLYQAIVHQETTSIALTLIFAVVTSVMVHRYNNTAGKEKQKN